MEKTVWVNGCFDVLHVGHVELLEYAKSLGTILLVGLDSDQKVRNDKGEGRPINTLTDRIRVISALECVDHVVSFDSTEELAEWIRTLRPGVLVVGSDWKGKPIVGGEYAKEIVYFERIGNYSSTAIIKQLEI